ncbi:MAG: bifunctional adenosylcobinamide kinase/adenosylcobinamide-phosphate guanylyltransferase, partial [bacterium]
MGRLILITGGERSGKSRLACRLASMFSDSPAFIATAEPKDDEMRRRIEEHRKSRPESWLTIEEPVFIRNAVENCGRDVVIIDCLTLWLSNHLQSDNVGAHGSAPLREIRTLIELARQKELVLIIVTNEVGMGIIPANPLARKFTHLQGLVNQTVADASDTVIAMISGQPLLLKGNVGARHAVPLLIPFRIGTTSYIYPADIEMNIRKLAHRVDDVELVIFESEQVSAYPSAEDVLRFSSYAARANLTFTVHLPLKCSIAHPDKKCRQESVEEIVKLIHRTKPLMPFSYILHVPIEEIQTENRKVKILSAEGLKVWQGLAVE